MHQLILRDAIDEQIYYGLRQITIQTTTLNSEL